MVAVSESWQREQCVECQFVWQRQQQQREQRESRVPRLFRLGYKAGT